MNMGFTFLLILFLITVAKPQIRSSESINQILDKLIQQVSDSEANYNDDSAEFLESYYPVPVDTKANTGKDSDIYFFKTYMAPQIKYKNNEENVDKHVESTTTVYAVTSEDKLLPATDTYPGYQSEDILRRGVNDDDRPQTQSSDYIDKKLKLIEELIKSYKLNKPILVNTPNGPVTERPLSLLHNHPEYVIDKLEHADDTPPTQIESRLEQSNPLDMSDKDIGLKRSNGNIVQTSSKLPSRSDIQSPTSVTSNESHEKTISEVEIEELKHLRESIAQNTELQNSILKEIREHEVNKQNNLLKEIIEKLAVNKVKVEGSKFESRSGAPYPEAIPYASEADDFALFHNLQHDMVSPNYLQAPLMTYPLSPRVPMLPYTPDSMLGFSRNSALQQARLRNRFVNRGISRYPYGNLPARYG